MLPCAGGENIGFDFSGDQKVLSTLLLVQLLEGKYF